MDRFSHRNNLTPFDTNWREGSGATPLATQDLFFGDAISIPTAPTKAFYTEWHAVRFYNKIFNNNWT